ncbi:N-acyl-D-glucosamine 2-epimerase, partial [Paenibacillus sp. MCAF20]
AYEYHTGGYMYDDKPAPMRIERVGEHEVRLTFNKRIDARKALQEGDGMIWIDGRASRVVWESSVVDGNRITLRSIHLPESAFELELSGIRDTPDRWLFSEKPPNSVAIGTKVTVPGARRG